MPLGIPSMIMALATPTFASLAPRTRRLLEAPIAPTLLRLAVPNVLMMVVQAEEQSLTVTVRVTVRL